MTTSTPDQTPRPRRDRWFQTDDLVDSLGKRSARGGVYTLGSTAFNFVVTTVSTILITRQLTDEDFGLYGMVIVLTGFANLFANFGLSRAVVQRPHVTHEQVSTLFWINLGICGALALIVAAATPLIVAFYDEPRLAPINLAMAGLFVVAGLGRQHRALLERRMEFGRINLVASCNAPVGAILGVVVAFLGGGYWALVAIPAGTAVVGALGMWLACGWVPGPPRRRTGVRDMLAFGGHVTGFQFINYLSRNADNAMLGYAWGAAPLGLYTRAYSLMMLPITRVNAPLSTVIIPALSRLNGEPDRYRMAFRQAVALTAGFSAPLVMLLAALAPEFIPVLFGESWASMTPIFLALSPATLMACTNAATNWLYLSHGHVRQQTRVVAVSTFFALVSMAAGVQWGAIGLAIAISAFRVAAKLPIFAFACRPTPVGVGDFLAAIAFPYTASVLAAAAAGVSGGYIHASDPVVLTCKTLVFLGLYIALLFGTPWGRRHFDGVRRFKSRLRPDKAQ
ncbi:MAG: lipopolysaccharide biosynthesis protein [Planctomycetota bacterium]